MPAENAKGATKMQKLIAATLTLVSLTAYATESANGRPTQLTDEIESTSTQALENCKAANLRHGIVADCTKTDFNYKTMKEVEANRAKQAKTAAAAKAQAARPGVRIGMTQMQVINETNWGKPRRVNRTTTATGTREQWVYGDGNYLYFVNGTLTSIQN